MANEDKSKDRTDIEDPAGATSAVRWRPSSGTVRGVSDSAPLSFRVGTPGQEQGATIDLVDDGVGIVPKEGISYGFRYIFRGKMPLNPGGARRVQLYDGEELVHERRVKDSGDWESGLSDVELGHHAFKAVASDDASVESETYEFERQLPPEQPIIYGLEADNIAVPRGGTTSKTNFIVSGTSAISGDSGIQVDLFDGDNLLLQEDVSPDGYWFASVRNLAIGHHVLKVVARYGRKLESETFEFDVQQPST